MNILFSVLYIVRYITKVMVDVIRSSLMTKGDFDFPKRYKLNNVFKIAQPFKLEVLVDFSILSECFFFYLLKRSA